MPFFSLIFLLCLSVFCPQELEPTLTVFSFRAADFYAVFTKALPSPWSWIHPLHFSCTIVRIIVSTLKSWSHLEWIFGNEEWDRNPVEDFLRWLASCSCAICQTHPLPFIFILFPVLEGPCGSMESPERSPRKYHVDFPQVCQRPTRRPSPGSCRALCHQNGRAGELSKSAPERAPLLC